MITRFTLPESWLKADVTEGTLANLEKEDLDDFFYVMTSCDVARNYISYTSVSFKADKSDPWDSQVLVLSSLSSGRHNPAAICISMQERSPKKWHRPVRRANFSAIDQHSYGRPNDFND